MNLLVRERVSGFANRLYRSKGGLWLRDIFVPKHQNIIYVLGRQLRDGREIKEILLGHNIVTDAGDVWYAQSAAGEAVTNNFNTMHLSTVAFSPAPSKTTDCGDLASAIAGSNKTVSATYPKTNDADADNTGAGTDVVTHLFDYAKGDFNDTDIEGVTISTAAPTFGSGADPVLNARNETAFAKTANDTLKVFINHTMNGV